MPAAVFDDTKIDTVISYIQITVILSFVFETVTEKTETALVSPSWSL